MEVLANSTNAVNAICKDQDIGLVRPLENALQNPSPNAQPAHIYAPNEFLLAIGIAGKLLRSGGPNRKLANTNIVDFPEAEEKVAVRSFIDMVNASVLRKKAPKNSLSFTCGRRHKAVHGCAAAEQRFMRTIEELENNLLTDGYMTHGAQIIMDRERPIFLKKGGPGSAKTSLSLEQVYINGVPYPPGSIISTPIIKKVGAESLPNKLLIKDDRVEVVNVDQVINPAFIRLSAFALSPPERSDDFTFSAGISNHANLARRAREITIQQIGTVASRAAKLISDAGGTVVFS